LNPVLTIQRQLTESLELHRGMDPKASREEAIKLLSAVNIPDPEKKLEDYPHQFSGGMQQRMMIAMAVSCNPDLLIADEPTTALDVTVQAQILEVMKSMQTRLGTAVIIITHNLGIVARYADNVQVMYAGRLVEGGSTDAIYNNPKHPYTTGLINAVPRLDLHRRRGLNVIPGLPPDLSRLRLDMCAFSPRCKYAIDRCNRERPELEEIEPGHVVACFRSQELSLLGAV
jgi:oligopeptide transport system ATP-binding protein